MRQLIAICALNITLWAFTYDHLTNVPRKLTCHLIETDPLGGRRYLTIHSLTVGELDPRGGIICRWN